MPQAMQLTLANVNGKLLMKLVQVKQKIIVGCAEVIE
jgi:hypothetical protein